LGSQKEATEERQGGGVLLYGRDGQSRWRGVLSAATSECCLMFQFRLSFNVDDRAKRKQKWKRKQKRPGSLEGGYGGRCGGFNQWWRLEEDDWGCGGWAGNGPKGQSGPTHWQAEKMKKNSKIKVGLQGNMDRIELGRQGENRNALQFLFSIFELEFKV
jgi:hypothetical protein